MGLANAESKSNWEWNTENPGNGETVKNSKMFSLSKFSLEEYLLASQAWDFQVTPEINKWCLLSLCGINSLVRTEKLLFSTHSETQNVLKQYILIYSLGMEKYKTACMLSRFEQEEQGVSMHLYYTGWVNAYALQSLWLGTNPGFITNSSVSSWTSYISFLCLSSLVIKWGQIIYIIHRIVVGVKGIMM